MILLLHYNYIDIDPPEPGPNFGAIFGGTGGAITVIVIIAIVIIHDKHKKGQINWFRNCHRPNIHGICNSCQSSTVNCFKSCTSSVANCCGSCVNSCRNSDNNQSTPVTTLSAQPTAPEPDHELPVLQPPPYYPTNNNTMLYPTIPTAIDIIDEKPSINDCVTLRDEEPPPYDHSWMAYPPPS